MSVSMHTLKFKLYIIYRMILNPLKVCHTKIDRMRSMGVTPLNFVVCRRMATKLPMKLPNAFLYAKLKSFCGVHIQRLAEIGDRRPSFSYPRKRVSAQQALECLDYLDANEPFDFSDGDVSGSGSDISYDGDLGDDSGDDENGAGDGEGPKVVDGDSDDDDDLLVVGRAVPGRGRGRCAGITCHLNHNGRRRAKRPRTLALASLLSSRSSLQDSRDFSSPRKDLVLGRDGGIGT